MARKILKLIALLAIFAYALPRDATASGFIWPFGTRATTQAGFFSGPFVPDPDIDLPADSTIDQQIAAGQKELARFQQTEPTLDHDEEFAAYIKDIVSRLLAAQDVKPPYPIQVHVSTGPVLNAFADPGGQIVFYSQMVE